MSSLQAGVLVFLLMFVLLITWVLYWCCHKTVAKINAQIDALEERIRARRAFGSAIVIASYAHGLDPEPILQAHEDESALLSLLQLGRRHNRAARQGRERMWH